MKLKTFKKFVFEQVEASTRKGIDHLHGLKPLEFINLVRHLKNDLKGIISKEQVQINLKIDGFSLRFGTDTNNKFFIESSHSGPVFEPGSFSSYTLSKKGIIDEVSLGYEDLLQTLKYWKELQLILTEYKGIKVFAECLYTKNAEDLGDQLKFLVIKYNKNKLGKHFTLVLYKAEDLQGKEIPLDEIYNKLKNINNEDIKFYSQKLDFDDLDINYELDEFIDFISKQNNIETILNSRRKPDKESKDFIIKEIKKFQELLTDKLLSINFDNQFSNEFEGLVFYLKHLTFKTVTSKYKTGKIEFNQERYDK